MKIKFKKSNFGQSLFEVLAAIFVISIVVVALVGVSTKSVRNTTFSRSQTQANRYTQEVLEYLRDQRDTNWESFVNNIEDSPNAPTDRNFCFNTLEWNTTDTPPCDSNIANTVFKREVYFTCALTPNGPLTVGNCSMSLNPEPVLVKAYAIVYWEDGQGRHESVASTYFTNN